MRTCSSPGPFFCAVFLLVVSGCSKPAQPQEPKTFGELPNAVTSAEPLWIPFRVRAGTAIPSDPRETHLSLVRQLTTDGTASQPRFTPDGTHVAYTSRNATTGCPALHVIALESGNLQTIAAPPGARGAAFSPDGASLFTAAAGSDPQGDCKAPVHALADLDLYRLTMDGAGSTPLFPSPGFDASPTLSPDGTRLLFASTRQGDLDLYAASPNGDAQPIQITDGIGPDTDPTISPNGVRMAWVGARPTGEARNTYRQDIKANRTLSGNAAIWIGSLSGGNARPVTAEDAHHAAPSFLADSRRIIFSSDVNAAALAPDEPTSALFVVDPDAGATQTGFAPLSQITFSESADADPAFSPDGKYLVFVSSRNAKAGERNVFVARWNDDP